MSAARMRRPTVKVSRKLYRYTDREGGYIVRLTGFNPRTKEQHDEWIPLVCTSLADAERERDRLDAALKAGSYTGEAEVIPTFAEFCAGVVGDLRRDGKRADRTLEAIDDMLAPWLDVLGPMRMDAITFADVDRARRVVWARPGDSDRTRQRRLYELRRMFKIAVARELRTSNPTLGIIVPTVTESAPAPPLEPARVAELLAWFDRYDLAACIGTPRKNKHYTGHGPYFFCQITLARRGGELCTLRWLGIDADDLSIRVRAEDEKTRAGIRVPIEPVHIERLALHRERLEAFGMPAMHPNACPLVFPSATGRVSHTGSRTSDLWRRACRELGIPDTYTAHDMRHAGASLLATHSSEQARRAVTGHRTEKMDRHYARAFSPDVREAVQRNVDLITAATRKGE